MMWTKEQKLAKQYAASGQATSFQLALVNFLEESGQAWQEVIMEHWGHLIADMADKEELDVILHMTVEAVDVARRRGHSMLLESDSKLGSGKPQRTFLCMNGNCCGYVQILPDPAPNQTNIGGTAIGLECPIGDEHHWDITKRTYPIGDSNG
jgi:hypothetical protein